MRNILMILALAAVAFPAQAAAPAAKPAPKPAAHAKRAMKRNRLTRAQAIAVVRRHVKGAQIAEAELEKEGGRLIWSFDVKTGAGIREIWVDPFTGKVINDKGESAAKESAEKLAEGRGKPEHGKRHAAAPAKKDGPDAHAR
ncbi:MAG: PepSY domain-containing protein [Elusimicrobia bacterium]|nr:PepSY domain-containing protein [Elusimicrobiota bacterium]